MSQVGKDCATELRLCLPSLSLYQSLFLPRESDEEKDILGPDVVVHTFSSTLWSQGHVVLYESETSLLYIVSCVTAKT